MEKEAVAGLPALQGETRRRTRRSLWYRFRRHRLALFGFSVLALFGLMALFAPIVAIHDPAYVDLDHIKEGPTLAHILGTDAAGRDVWARLWFAARVSLTVGIGAALISSAIGAVLGMISGYAGGQVDNFIQRFTEFVSTIPTFFAVILLVSLMGAHVSNLIIVIGVLGWTGKARLVRGQVLSLKEMEYVTAARALGASNTRIVASHIFPGAVPYIVVSGTLTLAGAIITEAGLSFLGLGVQFPTPTWGNMMNSAQSLHVLQFQPWLWLPPGIAIGTTVLAVNFLGDGLRDALDPRTKVD